MPRLETALERHPWIGYVLVALMALLMSFEGVTC